MQEYDHYIAVDWSSTSMALAKMARISSVVKLKEYPSNISMLKEYLGGLRGSKVMVIEESTPSQWLYVELRDHVDEIIICDPSRNHLLNEGVKSDKADAIKLVQLLRAGMLKPVFHDSGKLIELRKLVSGYEDVVKAGVRVLNQRSCYSTRIGVEHKEDLKYTAIDDFVMSGIDRWAKVYRVEKKFYEEEFERQAKLNPIIDRLRSVPGIGLIGAVKIVATVADPRRFKGRGKYLSYCGLVRLSKTSGGRSYGSKPSRYSRVLKSVYKTAAMAVIHPHVKSEFKEYYLWLIKAKGYPEYKARHALARRIATISLGVMKQNKNYDGEIIEKRSTGE